MTTSTFRFVATGDSFTEGLQDGPLPDGSYRGWADRVAVALATVHAEVHYANLAVRGKLLDEVVEGQVGPALEMHPTLLSFHGGGNDVLRPGIDLADLARRYDAAVARIRRDVPTVLLFTVLERSGATGRLADRLAARIGAFNAAVRATAARHDAVLIDSAAIPAWSDRRLWHEDRLHLNTEGHERVAAAVVAALGLDPELAEFAAPLPAARPRTRWSTTSDDLRWVRHHLLPWVIRRLRGISSGDDVVAKRPALTRVASPDRISR